METEQNKYVLRVPNIFSCYVPSAQLSMRISGLVPNESLQIEFQLFHLFRVKMVNKKGTKKDPVTVESTRDNVITD